MEMPYDRAVSVYILGYLFIYLPTSVYLTTLSATQAKFIVCGAPLAALIWGLIRLPT
jgi:hypothetical protein